MGTDGRSHDPVDAIGRGRFDQHLTTARLKPRGKVIGNRTYDCRLIAKPIFARFSIGHRRFAIAKDGADLGTMPFDSPSREVQCVVCGQLRADVLGDLSHHPLLTL
jgi:hypothetical protein